MEGKIRTLTVLVATYVGVTDVGDLIHWDIKYASHKFCGEQNCDCAYICLPFVVGVCVCIYKCVFL